MSENLTKEWSLKEIRNIRLMEEFSFIEFLLK